ncbi:MAG: thiolase family protein [Polyangiaceae bacterium]|nr:thiolase family protein [Polyangiaceae bacterium]
MKKLYLTKYAQSSFGKLGNYPIENMLRDAGSKELEDVDRNHVDHVAVAGLLAPLLSDQSLSAGLVALDPAYAGKSIKGVVNACDSGGLAVVDCATQILAGVAHVGLALGCEKMHPLEGKLDSQKIGLALGTAAHRADLFPPFTFPHAFAIIMDRYMKTYGFGEEDFAVVPPLFYANASHNPLAHMYKTKEPVTPKLVLGSNRLFPDLPLKLFECSQISDGWARILVCDDEGLARLGIPKHEATELAGFGAAVDGLSLASRGDKLLRPEGAQKAFQRAMSMAGARPADISLQEVHDCFSVMGPLSVEITGFADAGRGLPFFKDGHASVGGKCPINTSGGLIAKGHPISATGVAMVGWIHQQLLGRAPAPVQVKSARLGTTLNIGGPICSTVVTAQRPAA